MFPHFPIDRGLNDDVTYLKNFCIPNNVIPTAGIHPKRRRSTKIGECLRNYGLPIRRSALWPDRSHFALRSALCFDVMRCMAVRRMQMARILSVYAAMIIYLNSKMMFCSPL